MSESESAETAEDTEAQQQGGRTAKPGKNRKQRRIQILIAGIVVIVLLLIWGGVSFSRYQEEQSEIRTAARSRALILDKAFRKCQDYKGQEEGFTLGDGGRSLSYSSGDEGVVRGFSCIADDIGMPQATLSKISNTSGLSGTQTDEWNGIKITWSYNADAGLDAVFELVK